MTCSFDSRMAQAIDDWAARNKLRSRSEAMRALIAATLSNQCPNCGAMPMFRADGPAFAAAYQQALAELREKNREALVEAIQKVSRG
jgi:hypothetical protein